MIENFVQCCGFSLRQEGGFADVLGDPGGATNHGITHATLSVFLGRTATLEDMKAVDDLTALQIYKPMYWNVINGDNLPLGVDMIAMDFAITSGPLTAARTLQRILGVNSDGFIGKKTLAEAARWSLTALAVTLTGRRKDFYGSLAGAAQFGAGWEARADRCNVTAVAMIHTG